MKITAEFIRSAASAADMPTDGLAELAMVGRSNVGKSSLINALLRQRVARTSATPGKTRLANLFRVQRGTATPFYLVDLPGFGFARGPESSQEFQAITRVYFERGDSVGLLLVDARHPGLESDLQAWDWLSGVVRERALVATKIDKLARGQRIRAMRELESVFHDSVLPISAVTGEGLDELWKLIARLLNSPPPPPRSLPPPRATAAPKTTSTPTSRTAASRQGRPTPRQRPRGPKR